ncbi:MAG TPA: response regulator [Candidatus Saccharimonadales bacterium]|jgi:DNA-binding response OmpR family regulator|nr:response regulator [Candidatus Saccharimonadales bacterium]
MSGLQKKVLIVEDERPLSHALDLKLQHEGFTTVVANNGEECLTAIKEQEFDVVLLDLVMPVFDGFQVLEYLQKQPKRPAVFVLSNLSQAEDEDRVMKLGAKKYFIKSDTSLEVIVNEVKQV